MNIIVILVLLIILIVLGMPIALALGISTFISLYFFSTIPLTILIEKMLLGVDNYLLLAIPLFVLAANIMNRAGITTRIFTFARSLVGRLPGALAHANIVASIFFAGMSGSAVADSAALGKIEIKAMEDQGYPKKFAAAVTCASATIGPIFPPSIPMVIYAGIAQVSVAKLFVGGVIPGLLIAVVLMTMVHFISVKNSYPVDAEFSWQDVTHSFIDAFLPLLAPVIVIGGILAGFFSPTEAAAIATLYAIIVGFIYKELKFADFPEIFVETALTSSVILFIISTSSAFSWYLNINQIGMILISFVKEFGITALSFIIISNIMLILLGMFMETTTLLIILTPLLLPIANSLQINLVYMGVLIVFNLMIGLTSPPFGLGLFTVSEISETPLEDVITAVLPFIPVLIIALILTIIFPQIIVWLPNMMLH